MPLPLLIGAMVVGQLATTGISMYMQHQQHQQSMAMLQQFQAQNDANNRANLEALGAPGYGPQGGGPQGRPV